MEQGRQYYAFISYKREDEKWAKWLQRKLEHYRFPTNINGYAELPKYIRPIFRDTTDLTPGLLVEEIDSALRSSEWLIVICSSRSAKSPWVCKEVQQFIDMGRADHIIPFVIEGTPFSNDATTECYPDTLLKLTGSQEILAANINEMGRDAAAIKVVARMFNLRFDTVWQRWEREQKRRSRWIAGLMTLGLVVAMVIIGVMYYQHNQLQISLAKSAAAQAELYVDKGDTDMAKTVLAEVLPCDVGEVEAALRRSYDSRSIVLRGHNSPVEYINCSPDGRFLVSAANDTSIKVWDTASFKCIKTFKDDCESIWCVRFAPDNKSIISATSNGIKIWDIELGECVKTIKDDIIRSYSTEISNDGRYVIYASTYDYGIKIWDLLEEKCLHHIERNYNWINYISISPDNKYFIVADKDIELWDIEKGSCIKKYNIKSQLYSYTSAVFSPDGTKIASTDRGRVIRIWDINTGECIESYNCFTDVSNVMFCPDNTSVLVIADANTIRKYRAYENIISESMAGEILATGIRREESIIASYNCYLKHIVHYNQDGRFIISSGDDGNIYIADMDPCKELIKDVYDINNWIRHITESPTGEVLGLAYYESDRGFSLYNITTSSVIREFEGHSNNILCATLSKDCKYIISASRDNSIKLWSVETGECIMSYEDMEHPSLYVKIADSGKYFVSIYPENIIKLHDINTGETIKSFELQSSSGIRRFDVSPKGDTLAVTTTTGVLKFISIDTGKCINTIKISKGGKSALDVVYSKNGEYIAIATYGCIKVWNLKSNVCVKTFDVGFNLPYYTTLCATFSEDGKRIYVGDLSKVYLIDFVPLSTLVETTMSQYK